MKYKKYSYLEIKEIIEKQGYTLLSKEYLNCYKQKLELLCPKGHLYLTTFVNFLDGKNPGTSCSTCYGNAKISKETVVADLTKHGYTLESEYSNSQTPMSLRCPAGHERRSDYCNFRNNPKCPICERIDREAKGIHPRSIIAKKLWLDPKHVAKMKKVYATRKKSSFPHYTREIVKGYLEAEGYKLLSEAYRVVSDLIDVECPVGHRFQTSFGDFYYSGERCDKCYHIRRSIEQTGKHHSPERIAKILASLCARPNGFETRCMTYLEKLYPGKFKYTGDGSFIVNHRSADAYSEELNMIALFHGTYWHLGVFKRENTSENKRYEETKTAKPFLKAGYRVLIIWEDELANLAKKSLIPLIL